MSKELDPQGENKTLVVPGISRYEDIVRLPDAETEGLIDLLSRPTQALTSNAYLESIAKRQEAVNKHLLRGGADTLRRLFELIKQREEKMPVKLDLSMLEISGKVLSGLYLPGANLEKIIFTESDLMESNILAANLKASVANRAIMREVIATGADFTDAVMPHVDLSGARLIGCTFVNTIMTDVIVDRETNFAGARFVGTYLAGTDLSRANLTGATFRGIRR